MYSRIGKKIKGLAIFFCVIGIIGSVFSGIGIMLGGAVISDYLTALLPNLSQQLANAGNAVALVAGIAVMVVGFLLSWISTWLLYGFGELIDKVTDIEDNMYYLKR